MRVILASASPRRRELLKQIYDEFEIIPAEGEEERTTDDPALLVEQLSAMKAREVYDRVMGEYPETGLEVEPDLIVIGSDTVVAYDGHILGKPADEADAVRMLRMLSGNTHQVYTGVTIITSGSGSAAEPSEANRGDTAEDSMENPCFIRTFHEKTDVVFKQMTDEDIYDYVNTGEPMDKAGAYGIQGLGRKFVDHIIGDFDNVVGFPVARVREEILQFHKLPRKPL